MFIVCCHKCTVFKPLIGNCDCFFRFQFTEVLKSLSLYVKANMERSLSISVVWMGLVTWNFYTALV